MRLINRNLNLQRREHYRKLGDIMERLNDVIPKLDAGVTPKELLEEQYLQSQSTTELPKIDFKPIIQNSNVVDAVKEEEFDNEIDEIEPEIEPEEFDITDEEFEEASEMDEDTKIYPMIYRIYQMKNIRMDQTKNIRMDQTKNIRMD